MRNTKRKKEAEVSCLLCQMIKEAEENGEILTDLKLKAGFKKMKEGSAVDYLGCQDTRLTSEDYLLYYHQKRPHISLGMRPPLKTPTVSH